jgi:hypothetical protein
MTSTFGSGRYERTMVSGLPTSGPATIGAGRGSNETGFARTPRSAQPPPGITTVSQRVEFRLRFLAVSSKVFSSGAWEVWGLPQ